MAAPDRRLREKRRLKREQSQGWSKWKKAMVPLDPHRKHRGDPDQVGLIHSRIEKAFRDKARHCGIYEWRAEGTLSGQPDRTVVYVGSTCRCPSKPGVLLARILEYCRDGSHKKDLINDALRKGYELWVRVKVVEGKNPRKGAEKMENALLNKYDYAWNTRLNGEIRYILP